MDRPISQCAGERSRASCIIHALGVMPASCGPGKLRLYLDFSQADYYMDLGSSTCQRMLRCSESSFDRVLAAVLQGDLGSSAIVLCVYVCICQR